MNRLTFTDTVDIARTTRTLTSRSGITRLLQKYSFGLIQTERQALICKMTIVLLSLVWLGFVLLSENDTTFQLPSDELINSPQPINN